MNQQLSASSEYLDADARIFLRRVLESRLADLTAVKKVIRLLAQADTTFSLGRIANGLVNASVITRWQRDMLLKGKKRGFFLGKYVLRKPIGRGGMSVVYLGQHQRITRPVALKILPPDEATDPRMVDRFEREANIAAQLDHVNVARIFEYDEVENKHFIVMEYVNGYNLHEVIDRRGPLSISDAIDVALQTTAGLMHTHDRGIIHRDVKPTNLLWRNDGVIKVIDLGLAKMGWPDLQGIEPNRLMGTADYISPEQIENAVSVDARTDIYSLGCTLFFALTGQPPYPGRTVSSQLAKHQTSPIPDPSQYRSDIPDALVNLLRRMMAKRTEDRPRSASELHQQIRLIQDNVPSVAPRRDLLPPGDTVRN